MKVYWKTVMGLAALAATLVFVAASAAGSGLGNGDFERGDFTNWSTDAIGAGIWEVYSGNKTSLLDIPFYRPPQGNYAATTEEEGPAAMVLYRTLPLGFNKTQQVSFWLYYQQDGQDFEPDGQEYRIDILRDGAEAASTDPGDILKTLFRTKPGDKLSMSPKLKTYVLSNLHGPVTLRLLVFVCTGSLYCAELNAGVDNVKLGSAS